MATSESDDFESADEELAQEQRRPAHRKWSPPTAIDSESDDDTECVPRDYERVQLRSAARPRERDKSGDNGDTRAALSDPADSASDVQLVGSAVHSADSGAGGQMAEAAEAARETAKVQRRKPEGLKLGARRLGAKVVRSDEEPRKEAAALAEGTGKVPVEGVDCGLVQDLSKVSVEPVEEAEVGSKPEDQVEIGDSLMHQLAEPEELKSNKKFKEIFEPQGWEGLGNDIELPDDLTEEKLQPVLDRLSSVGGELEGSSGGWGSWGSWGVSTLLNTATAGVSTLTSHVTHGLTLLEESIGTPDSPEDAENKEEEESLAADEDPSSPQEGYPLSSFGFGNFISGVSSITKLVESTGSKVMSGGLDTLEAIGKKTMEVLQEGDPGLKKKRAFFTPDADKPNLSQVLREAKERADAAEKTLEEKQWARKIHFESLFDDYQGLVHLEALEMLSKQSSMKIQQHLANLTGAELNSIQETLEDVKELCDPSDEDEEDAEASQRELRLRLEDACSDLGLDIAYEKLCTIWDESQAYLSSEHSAQETFQAAISALAQFTAFSIERFHKTAELLLIKQRRSTVNEADALVQLTRILSNQIGLLANRYCGALNELAKAAADPEEINGNVTTVFLEATNASSYVEDAFRLLIPIVQVGAV